MDKIIKKDIVNGVEYKYNGIGGGSSSAGEGHEVITQAAYDQLTPAQKAEKVYMIKESGTPVPVGPIEAEDVDFDNTGTGMQSDNVQDAIEEVFQSVSNGKTLIAAAITDKGVSTAASDSFQTMATNIRLIGQNVPGGDGQQLIQGDYTLLRGPCDGEFHVPLVEEWQAIINTGITIQQIRTNLHIPCGGGISYDGTTPSTSEGNIGKYWGVTTNGSNAKCFYMYITENIIQVLNQGRSNGYPIRAFRNYPKIPDNTRTETVTGKVWYNPKLSLISILVGTNQYVTIQDKNVGAYHVWNPGDTLSSANMGYYFQWGNDYRFPRNNSRTSSTKIDASSYGPNNHYEDSTFRTVSTSDIDWSTVQNDNLRGYTDFTS